MKFSKMKNKLFESIDRIEIIAVISILQLLLEFFAYSKQGIFSIIASRIWLTCLFVIFCIITVELTNKLIQENEKLKMAIEILKKVSDFEDFECGYKEYCNRYGNELTQQEYEIINEVLDND